MDASEGVSGAAAAGVARDGRGKHAMRALTYEGLRFEQVAETQGTYELIMKGGKLFQKFDGFTGVIAVERNGQHDALTSAVQETPAGKRVHGDRPLPGATPPCGSAAARESEELDAFKLAAYNNQMSHYANGFGDDSSSADGSQHSQPASPHSRSLLSHSDTAAAADPQPQQQRTPDWIRTECSDQQSSPPPHMLEATQGGAANAAAECATTTNGGGDGDDDDMNPPPPKRPRTDTAASDANDEDMALTQPMHAHTVSTISELLDEAESHVNAVVNHVQSTAALVQPVPCDNGGGGDDMEEEEDEDEEKQRRMRRLGLDASEGCKLDVVSNTADAAKPAATLVRSPGALACGVTLRWRKLRVPQSTAPCGRWGFGCAALPGGRVVVSGGQDEEDQHLSDTHVLDLSTCRWSKVKDCDRAHAWFGSILCSDTDVLMVGGQNDDRLKKPIADKPLMLFDTRYNLWINATCAGVKFKPVSGITPVKIDKDHVVVFGGNTGRQMTNTLWVLNIKTWEWTRPAVSGPAPKARVYYGACALPGMIVYFGGNDKDKTFERVWLLHTDTWAWEKLSVAGQGPVRRSGVKMVALSDTTVLFHGGSELDEDLIIYDDMHILDVNTRSWTRPNVEGDRPVARSGHALVPVEEGKKFLCWGGMTDDGVANDAYVVERVDAGADDIDA